MNIGGKVTVSLLFICLVFLSSCLNERSSDGSDSSDSIPENLLSTLKEKDIQAFLVYKGDNPEWSYYEEGWNSDNIHIIHSCTKSIVSLLIGTLIDSGEIESVNVPVYHFFSGIDPENISNENKKLTIEHFLTMTTGLKSRDSYLYNWQGLQNIWNKENWVEVILGFEQVAEPGEIFDYSNLASFLLGEIISEVSGMDVSEYAEKVLFRPLGINTYAWDKNIHNESTGWGGLHLKPSDLAKIGILVMNNGNWDGEQIVSSRWIELSTTPRITPRTLREHYGYHWWVDDENRIMAIGYRAQYLIIDRELDLVAVFASKLDDSDFFLPYRLYTTSVLGNFK